MSLFRAYRAHEALITPARPKAQVWRLVIGVILIAGVFLLANQFLHQSLFTLLGSEAYGALTGRDGQMSQLSVVFLLLSFGLLTVAVTVALKVAHNRGISAVFGNATLFRSQFTVVMLMLVILNAAVFALPPWDMGAPLVPNVNFGAWLVVLPFAIVAIIVQVSAEEILFRGYLQQQLAARFRSPLIFLLVPSVLFGLGHYMPEEAGENANIIMVWSVIFGVLMADLTARAGTLGPAIAVHFVNNVVAILFVSMPDSLSGLALYLSPFALTDTQELRAWLPVEFAMMVVTWLAARLAIRR
ncbi:CPBP family intramembrane glutamic endopeptidase [Roseobacter litoralis]|uniref:CPBP family intramembrane glutamic endopeptidase n=1 Tax=Roseobacter litoralis TaxID=42443 RepID=UPI0024911609|nr:CPBP family intramembrane glutamic endopeptidase [Roseobacter litoralis]